MIIENLIKQASQSLKDNNINSHELDAELLLSNIMGKNKEFLLLNKDLVISESVIKKYQKLIKRRAKKEPIAYITGRKEFWSQDFFINRSTLVPRPETEIMLYKIIKRYRYKVINILDIGTGSGCILLSLLKELSNSRGIGIDISRSAIEVAKKNSLKFNLCNRAKFKVFDINKFKVGNFDLITIRVS